jgi:hypothetical protein
MTRETTKKEVKQPTKIKLNKWYLFLTCLLNFFQSKAIAIYSVIFIAMFSFGVGYCLKYPAIRGILELEHRNKVEMEYQQRKEVEDKVRTIMSIYNCDSLIIYESLLNTFDPVFMATVLAIESEYKVNAISPAGALGLGQVMPYHFKKGQDWKNPKDNIAVASKLMEDFLKRFNGNKELALAAYNAGPNAVIKAGYKIPDTRNNETKNYVSKAQKLDKYLQKSMRDLRVR